MKKLDKTDCKKIVKAGLLSAAFSITFLLLTYIYWNHPFTFGFGDDMITQISMRRDLAFKRDFDDSKIVSVNVAYDKMLVPHIDNRDSTIAGVHPITDRGKLLTFLKMLKERDAYGYILCDVRFDEYETEYDEELFETIASMRNIIVATQDMNSTPEAIREKAAMAIFSRRTAGDDFLKYCYILPDGNKNLALRMWEDITGGKMLRKWWGYSMNGKACVRSIAPDFRYSIYDDIYETPKQDISDANKYPSKLYNLGAQVVEPFLAGYSSGKFFDGKMIMIGDFTENDFHTTIIGEQPGTIITFNSFLALMHEDNIIPFWIYLLLFIVFWTESMFVLRNRFSLPQISEERLQKIKNNKLRYVMSVLIAFISYNTPLIILAVIIYAISGVFINAIVIGSLLTLLSVVV